MQDVAPQDYRDAMACLGAAVSIVTTDGAAGRAGFTASAICSVTDDPRRFWFGIERWSCRMSILNHKRPDAAIDGNPRPIWAGHSRSLEALDQLCPAWIKLPGPMPYVITIVFACPQHVVVVVARDAHSGERYARTK